MRHPIQSFCIKHVEHYFIHDSEIASLKQLFIRQKDDSLSTIVELTFSTFDEMLKQLELGQNFAILNFVQIASKELEDLFFQELTNFAHTYYEYNLREMKHTPENQQHYVNTLNRTFGYAALAPTTVISERTYFIDTPADGTRSNQYSILPLDMMKAYRDNVLTRLPIFEGSRHE